MFDINSLIEKNRRYAAESSEVPEDAAPSKRLAILTCMDVRIDPRLVFGLTLGEAHVLRNAGARVTEDVIRSLVLSQRALGTDTVLVMPHTRCGLLGLDVKTLRREGEVDWPSLDFRIISDLRESLHEDLAAIRANPWIHGNIAVFGCIYDVDARLVGDLVAV